MTNRTIQVYTNAPMAELTVNGKSQGRSAGKGGQNGTIFHTLLVK